MNSPNFNNKIHFSKSNETFTAKFQNDQSKMKSCTCNKKTPNSHLLTHNSNIIQVWKTHSTKYRWINPHQICYAIQKYRNWNIKLQENLPNKQYNHRSTNNTISKQTKLAGSDLISQTKSKQARIDLTNWCITICYHETHRKHELLNS